MNLEKKPEPLSAFFQTFRELCGVALGSLAGFHGFSPGSRVVGGLGFRD